MPRLKKNFSIGTAPSNGKRINKDGVVSFSSPSSATQEMKTKKVEKTLVRYLKAIEEANTSKKIPGTLNGIIYLK